MKTENKIIIGVVLATIVLIVGGVLLSDKNGTDENERLSKPMVGEKMAYEGDTHVAPGQVHPAYMTNPPTSGYHWAGVAGPGIKNEPVPDELLLHSMEHGAVVVWYREGLEESDVNTIKEAFMSASGKKIMVPRANLDVPVALTSWGYMMKMENIDAEKIKEFIETNNDRAPEKAAI